MKLKWIFIPIMALAIACANEKKENTTDTSNTATPAPAKKEAPKKEAVAPDPVEQTEPIDIQNGFNKQDIFHKWRSHKIEKVGTGKTIENMEFVVEFKKDLTYINIADGAQRSGAWDWENETLVLDGRNVLTIVTLDAYQLVYEFNVGNEKWRYWMTPSEEMTP